MPSSPPSNLANPVKIILVTGGVISGVGKGIVSSSLGVLLKANGYRVTAIKIDPYLNLDAGTFSPWEHGEVFVLDDGGEVDLDLGNYERFLNVCLTSDNNITTGKIYDRVITAERAGKYLGKTVQVVPHVTDAIKQWVEDVAQRPVDKSGIRPDVCIVELGGTGGDIESMPYMHAMADFMHPDHRSRFMHVHVSMLIDLESTGETKTKPLQHSVEIARTYGLLPDILVCRSERPITNAIKEKIGNSCRIKTDQVIGVHNVSNIYRVPLLLMQQNVLEEIEKQFELNRIEPRKALRNCPNIPQWTQLADLTDKYANIVKIALVGKYFQLDQTTDESRAKVFTDAYSSVIKALHHSATHGERKLKILFVISENLEDDAPKEKQEAALKLLEEADGILVPGGFGLRGIEGKIVACEFARKHKKPFLGICLGMQCAAIEFARNVCRIHGASSTEFWEEQQNQDTELINSKALTSEQKIVIKMLEHSGGDMGGTMRLGRRATEFLTTDSILFDLYGKNQVIEERHRHRYEINPAIVPMLTETGLRFVGMGVDQTKTNGNVTEASDGLLNIAREKNENGEKSFIEKVKKLCDRGEETHTSVRMEMVELKDHPYFVGVQYHPEYTSHPLSPSPPFLGLILAASNQLKAFIDKTRVPSPVNMFHDAQSSSTTNATTTNTQHSNFYYLPSAGNSSTSLKALNENFKHSSGTELKVPTSRFSGLTIHNRGDDESFEAVDGGENSPPAFNVHV